MTLCVVDPISRGVNTCLAKCLNSVLNLKAVVAAFNQEKALVGAFSVITNLRMKLFEALVSGLLRLCLRAGSVLPLRPPHRAHPRPGRLVAALVLECSGLA